MLGVEILTTINKNEDDDFIVIFQNPPHFYRDILNIKKKLKGQLEILEQYVIKKQIANIIGEAIEELIVSL